MAAEGMLSFSVASVLEDFLRQYGTPLSDNDLASREAEEASSRRNEATRWLRKIVGVVCSKDLPAQPSEEDFRLGLRSGIILCTALNKIQPGAVPKVVEALKDTVLIPDDTNPMANQYFENVRTFLVAMEEMGLPTFEASDLEKGGKTERVVNCVLALKSFSDWKVAGSSGSWKFSGSTEKPCVGKTLVRKNSEPFLNSISRTSSVKSLDTLGDEQYGDIGLDFSDMSYPRSLNMMIRALLMNRKQEEIANIVESMLGKVTEAFEHRLGSQTESVKTTPETMSVSGQNVSPTESPKETQNDDETSVDMVGETEQVIEEEKSQQCVPYEAPESQLSKYKTLFEQQKSDIRELKHTIYTMKESIQFQQMKYHEEFSVLGKHLDSLAHVASGYQKVLEENRKLYNQVQDLKGNIRVYCRVRPSLPGQENISTTIDHIEDGKITIMTPSKYGKEGKKSFTFNKVFGPTTTQAAVFADIQPLVRSVLDGYNVCIFAYGQTGSGKTYTMTGPNNLTEETYGVNYRALNDLFLLKEQREATISYEVSVQMMEIYNEKVRDLLATDVSNTKSEIYNSSQNGINEPNANRLPVSSISDVIDLMNLGQKNRAVSSTSIIDHTSRSHSCMIVHVHGQDLTSRAILRGCMHLVDLAGSERVDKSELTGDRLKEAQNINESLAELGDVIASLASKNPRVPYKNSKLTRLLQDSLGRQAKALMLVHISPEADDVGETISTLEFAECVSNVELGAARGNKETGDVKELKEQVASQKRPSPRKGEENEQLSLSLSNTPESMSVKSTASSPVHPTSHVTKDTSDGRRSPAEEKSTASSPVQSTWHATKDTSDDRTSPVEEKCTAPSPVQSTWHATEDTSDDRTSPVEEKSTASSPVPPTWHATKDTSDGRISPVEDMDNVKEKNNTIEKPQRQSLDPDDLLSNAADWPPLSAIKAEEKVMVSRNWIEKVMMNQDKLDRHSSSATEPELQVNLRRVASVPNSLGSNNINPQVKASKSPEKRSSIPMPLSRRSSYGANSPAATKNKNRRQSVNMKGKIGNAK